MVVLSHLISYWSVFVGVTIYATIYRFDPVVECYHTHIYCHK
jgi:glutathionyl-hydroquinone reductase